MGFFLALYSRGNIKTETKLHIIFYSYLSNPGGKKASKHASNKTKPEKTTPKQTKKKIVEQSNFELAVCVDTNIAKSWF